MKSLEELKKIREAALKKVEMREGGKDYRVVVGMATCGIAAGARPVLNRLVEETAKKDYNCTVSQTGCIG
ncbi:MAG: (2Fe-2S) ferredoxin domain-containing protein, partial [Oscillospiraceae bacterium]|nr:(2Fe-2S) ferredoxin domain-containing protein [Oscillospiraceae bacterium]